MSTPADLPDLNFWLALVWPEHSHHQHAVHYWEVQASDQVLYGWRLVSFDRDFERFAGLQRLPLP